MPFNFFKYFFAAFCLLLFSCNNSTHEIIDQPLVVTKDNSIKYAKRFAIASTDDLTFVYLFGNKNNFDTTATYVVYKDSSRIKNIPKNCTLVKSQCKKIAALSSIYASMIYELGLISSLAAIDNADYINNVEIISGCNNGTIKELSKGPEPDIEAIIQLNPDIIFTFGMGDPKKDVSPKLLLTKIPVAVSLDHKEETLLARAEWIKFFAAFTGKKEKADSIFNIVEQNYNTLSLLVQQVKSFPTVFTDIKYSDSWYVPGGKSYMAQLLNDAGAYYLWKDDINHGSVPLSFEQVYAKAKTADFWINQSTLKTKKEVFSFDSRFAEFNAFKTGNLFNNTKFTNSKGYSTYWETGMIFPDRILHDLILIFHPELKTEIKNDLYYYEQLK